MAVPIIGAIGNVLRLLAAFGILIGVFAAVLAVGFHPVYQHNVAVQEHKPANATVIDTDLERVDGDYRPNVTYEYTVDGDSYQSSNLWPGQWDRSSESRSSAEAILEEYQIGDSTNADGEQVTAFYNPESPGEAYLRNDDGWPTTWWAYSIFAGLVGLVGLYAIRTGFVRWRERKLIEDTPTETIGSISVGPSEINGTVVTGDQTPLSAPFSDDECVVAWYEVEEYRDRTDVFSWQTIDSGLRHTPFYVTDGTGTILIEPHDSTVYDLDMDDESVVYVDSSDRGSKVIQQFVESHDSLSFPSRRLGKKNDRKYKQNLIRPGDEVYVFGTVHPAEGHEQTARNPERLTIAKTDSDSSLREPLFLISDTSERTVIDSRGSALGIHLPVGIFCLAFSFMTTLLIYGPLLGLQIPVLY